MGSFSWLRANVDTEKANIAEGDKFACLIPKEFGVKDFAELRSSYSTNVINELTQQVVKYIEDNYGEETEFTWDTEESNTLPY